ncbi:MAG: toxin-antitoxin system HicB family antitoxin [Chloroflexi bacterium]|nr:toxin-antitoxin system HicB family antitoxin [Chloroflexota bacterium]
MKPSDYYLKIVAWNEEDGCYIGRSPGLLHGGVHGMDEVAIYQELCEVIEEWLTNLTEDGLPLPPPTAERSYSGKFMLRVPPHLHERLAVQAMLEGDSLNNYCKKVLEKVV